MTSALVIGALGQDGRYLIRLLLEKGYHVVGAVRNFSAERPDPIEYVSWDMSSSEAMTKIIADIRPREIYNLAGKTSGAGMFDNPEEIGDVNGLAVVRMLEAIRTAHPESRFVQASSSEIFGRPDSAPQSENSAVRPRSPYGAAKLYAHAMIDIYRRRFGLFVTSAILYNHESALRRPEFVTRKVTMAVARALAGSKSKLVLGDLDATRDWGFAGDSVRAMWQMVQGPDAKDYVVSTGISRTVADLCQVAFGTAGLDWRDFVVRGTTDIRPREAVPLVGDSKRIAQELGWRPEVPFDTMIKQMVQQDEKRVQNGIEGVINLAEL